MPAATKPKISIWLPVEDVQLPPRSHNKHEQRHGATSLTPLFGAVLAAEVATSRAESTQQIPKVPGAGCGTTLLRAHRDNSTG